MTNTGRMTRRQFIRSAGLGAAALGAAAVGLGGAARAVPTPVSTTVFGQNNPAVDANAIRSALLSYSTVYLQGTFDLGTNMYLLVPSNSPCKEIIGQGAVVKNGVYGFLVYFNSGVAIKNITLVNQRGGRPLVLFGSNSCILDGNTVVNSSPGYGITVRSNAYQNVITNNDLTGLTAIHDVRDEGAHIEILDSSHENLVTNNAIGPLAASGQAAVICQGQNNQVINNEFGNSGIVGLKYGTQVCVLLGKNSRYNTVFEQGNYPAGTGGAQEQVVDLSRELTGTTTNRVVGHPADFLAEGINPGIGTVLSGMEERLDALSAQENMEIQASIQQ